MASYDFPSEERRKLREYFHQSAHLMKAAAYGRLTARMSPKLQGEVAMRCNGTMLRGVPCFRLIDDEFIARVANTLRPCVYTPSEQVTPGFFYTVHSGIALYGGQVVNYGGFWVSDVGGRDPRPSPCAAHAGNAPVAGWLCQLPGCLCCACALSHYPVSCRFASAAAYGAPSHSLPRARMCFCSRGGSSAIEGSR